MSDPPPPASTASYIIICSGRIAVQATKDPLQKIKAASDCASQVVSFIELTHGSQVTPADTLPVSNLQHEMMNKMLEWNKEEIEAKCKSMFYLLYQLEKKFPPLDVM
jgi:hypothetical protein